MEAWSAGSYGADGLREEKTQFPQRLVILLLVDFKLVTLCTVSSIMPLIIPCAILLTHLPSLSSLKPGSSFFCTCSEDQKK